MHRRRTGGAPNFGMNRADKPRIRCSSLDQLLNCPGSRLVKERAGPRLGFDGVEGSAIHWETAWRIIRELGGHQPEGGLKRPSDMPEGYRIPYSSEWLVDWLFRIVRDEVAVEWGLGVEYDWEWQFEHFILCGHPDVFGISPDGLTGKIFDWKTGRVPVLPADCNWQGAGYLALAYLLFGLERAEFTIAQPWNTEQDGYDRISRVELSGAELARNVQIIEERVNAALANDLLVTGISQCKWCVGLKCPALQALLEDMKMRLTPEILAGIRANMDDAQLVDLVADCRTLTKPMEDAKEMLKARLEAVPMVVGASGQEVRLKESSSGFDVVDPVGMYGWLSGLLPEANLAKSLSYPGTKIKDQIAVALDIPKTGKAPMTAKSVFEGGAAAFIQATTKKELIFS